MASRIINNNDKSDNPLIFTLNPLFNDLNKIEQKIKEFKTNIISDLYCCATKELPNDNTNETRDIMTKIRENWLEQIKKHRDIHTSISKFGKTTDKVFSEKIDHLNSYFLQNTRFSKIIDYNNAINSLIFNYLVRVGRVSVASVFLEEEAVNMSEEDLRVLKEVSFVISSMHVHQFVPVKEWIKFNKNNMPESLIIKFEYIISKLEFLNTLSTEPANFEALIDCAKQMAIFARFFQPDFEYLMGSLAFIHNPDRIKQFYAELFLEVHDINSDDISSCEKMDIEEPVDLLSSYTRTQNIINSLYYQHYLNELVSMFSEQVFVIKQESPVDPLFTLFSSGMTNITEFYKHDQIFKKLYLYNKIDDFPLTVKKHDHNFQHSIFHCPVDKAIACGANSVLKLKCGHAISKSAFNQLTKNEQKTKMKCPYCPTETKTNEVLTLVL